MPANTYNRKEIVIIIIETSLQVKLCFLIVPEAGSPGKLRNKPSGAATCFFLTCR